MKKILTFLVILLLLVVACLFTAAKFAKGIITRVKPQIEEQASKALGTKVTIGDIDVGFWPNVTIETKNLSLGTQADAPKLGLFRASIGVTPLFSGNIAVREITISKPSITIRKTASNQIQIPGLALSQPPTTSTDTTEQKTTSTSDASKNNSLPVSVDLEKFALTDATLTYVDESNGQTIKITDCDLSTHLSISSNVLNIPDLDGSLVINGAPISYSAKGKFSPTAINLNELEFRAFDGVGTATSSGELNKHLASTLSMKGFKASEAISVISPQYGTLISGTLTELSAKVGSSFTPSAIVNVGDGSLEIKDGGIKGVNLIAPVVKAILKSDPSANGEGADKLELTTEEEKAINSKDTTFDTISSKFALQRMDIAVNSFSLANAVCELQGNGTIKYDGTLNIKAAIVLSERLTSVLVKKNKKLASVVRPDKRLEVPLFITGTAPDLMIAPDISALLQNALKGELGDKANKALEKAFGKKGFSVKGLGF